MTINPSSQPRIIIRHARPRVNTRDHREDPAFSVSYHPLASVLSMSEIQSSPCACVQPEHVGRPFPLLVLPCTCPGCVYAPWGLLKPVPWLQLLVLVNPLVYMSEGLRTVLTPDLPHMPVWAFLLALTTAVGLLGTIGVRGFLRRTIS